MAIKDMGVLDDAALQAELAASKVKKGGGGDYKKLRSLVVEQYKLPPGKTRFRLLPPETTGMPWMKFEEHELRNETDLQTEWKFVSFNCAAGMGAGECPAEAYLMRVGRWTVPNPKGGAPVPYPGSTKMVERGRAKQKFVANVVFTLWGGKPVPPDLRGVRVFKFGPGIWKGTDRNITGGLLALLERNRSVFDVREGSEIEIDKSGSDLDTAYPVSVVESEQEAMVGGRAIKVRLPVAGPIADSEEGISALLEARADLKMFLRLHTPDEVRNLIAKVNPMPETAGTIQAEGPNTLGPGPGTRARPMGTGTVRQPATPRGPNAQDELEFGGDKDDDNNIPFDSAR